MNAQHLRSNHFSYLLAGLLIFFLMFPVLRMNPVLGGDVLVMRVTMELGFSFLMLVSIPSLHQNPFVFRLGILLTVLSISSSFLMFFHRIKLLEVNDSLLTLVFCLICCYTAATDVFKRKTVDGNALLGAVCVYLLTGLIWAILYKIVADLWPHSFNGISDEAIFDDLLYFSFVTLASLGYGDITPVSPIARTLAYLEVITGQFYLAIMVAGLMGIYMLKRPQD